MRIAVIGPGNVGRALASTAIAAGHGVVAGVRDPAGPGADEARSAVTGLEVDGVADAVASAELVLLTLPYAAAESTLRDLGDLAGRIVVDCTNPVGPGLIHALGTRSGASVLAEAATHGRLVKCFNVYGVENLGAPRFEGAPLRGMMPVAGDDPAAKGAVADLAASMGWEPVDVGGLVQALHLEHLALLWIRMARVDRVPPRFVWARLAERP